MDGECGPDGMDLGDRSADFDNDGLSDLFFCNGIPRQFNHSELPEITHAKLVGKTHWDHYRDTPVRREQNLAYRKYDQNVQNLDGWEDFIVGINDGDPQIFLNELNERSENHPIRVRLNGNPGNPSGIGSKVTVEAGRGETDASGVHNEVGALLGQNEEEIWDALMKRVMAIPAYRELFQAAYADREFEDVIPDSVPSGLKMVLPIPDEAPNYD